MRTGIRMEVEAVANGTRPPWGNLGIAMRWGVAVGICRLGHVDCNRTLRSQWAFAGGTNSRSHFGLGSAGYGSGAWRGGFDARPGTAQSNFGPVGHARRSGVVNTFGRSICSLVLEVSYRPDGRRDKTALCLPAEYCASATEVGRADDGGFRPAVRRTTSPPRGAITAFLSPLLRRSAGRWTTYVLSSMPGSP
jgi:hypothetical protein